MAAAAKVSDSATFLLPCGVEICVVRGDILQTDASALAIGDDTQLKVGGSEGKSLGKKSDCVCV